MDDRTSVVIVTRDRPASLARTLDRLSTLRPAPPVIVVDNGSSYNASSDGASDYLDWLRRHPAVHRLFALDRNRAAAARTVGVRAAPTRYVAFSDDDSWWEPGALSLAADTLDRHPRLGLVAARTLVGPQQRPDPVNALMADSPLPDTGEAPGRPVLGCLACASVVRREAYLEVGGFHALLGIGGEEELLCYDLAAGGWDRRYLEEVVAHHHPAPARPHGWRRQALQRRNQVLVCWMRRPLPVAAAATWRLVSEAARDRIARAALAGAMWRLPAAVTQRRPLPVAVERQVRLIEGAPALAGSPR